MARSNIAMAWRVASIALLAAASGCSGEWDGGPAGRVRSTDRAGATASAPLASSRAAQSSRVTLPAAQGFASAPDRGNLAAYPATPVVREDGAYTWHRSDISEAHALAAIVSGRLQVKAPSGEILEFLHERHIEHPNGDWTWVGRLRGGAPGEETILTFGDKAVFGSIGQPRKEPLKLTIRNGVSWLVETDRTKLGRIINSATRPQDPDYLVPPKLASRAAADLPMQTSQGVATAGTQAAAAVSGTVVDLVLGYTSGFAAGLGGQSQANTRLNYLVDITNQAYINSQLDARVRLVRTVQVNYPDGTKNATALEELTGFNAPSTQSTPAAAFEELRAVRDQYGADLVSLVRKFNDPENEGCGIAWLIGAGQDPIIQQDEYFGYSVVSDGTDAGSDGKTYFCREETLAHELGHNMGSAHDIETVKHKGGDKDGVLDANEYGVFPYSFGYNTLSGAGNFFTVMAYGESGQTRYRTFSNPRTTYCGGLACGTADADNARSLTQTTPIVASFRATVVAPSLPIARARNDINADGRSDILWHNPGLQQMDWWLMNGAALQAVGSKGVGSQYRVAATGDFNGDGRGDILWRDDARTTLWIWQAEATGGFSILFVRPYPPQGWEVVGAADVNADGRSDILWHNTGLQQMDWWLMNGAVLQGVGSKFISSEYRVAATGDFNGDGRGDILWRDQARTTLWIWQSEPSGTFSIQFVGPYPSESPWDYGPAGWEVVGAADVNADGRSDILWHSPNSQLFNWWLMNGATVQAVGSQGIPSQYRVASTGDFNGDGRGDILWRDEGRTTLWIWQAEASGTFSILFVRPYPTPSWEVVGN